MNEHKLIVWYTLGAALLGILLGAAIAFIPIRPIEPKPVRLANQYDVEIAKIEAQSKLDVLNAKTKYDTQRVECVEHLAKTIPPNYLVEHFQVFQDLIVRTCGN